MHSDPLSEQSSATERRTTGFYRLSWLQRIGFGSGDLAQNLIYQTISMYLLFFYTNVYGLEPADAATMFLVVRLVDVAWDPLVGTFVDKHNPPLGKYRSYLLLGDTHLLCYGVGDSPYGPFRFRGELLQPVIGWTTHHSICQYHGHTYLFHHDSQPSGGKTWLRSLKIKEINIEV